MRETQRPSWHVSSRTACIQLWRARTRASVLSCRPVTPPLQTCYNSEWVKGCRDSIWMSISWWTLYHRLTCSFYSSNFFAAVCITTAQHSCLKPNSWRAIPRLIHEPTSTPFCTSWECSIQCARAVILRHLWALCRHLLASIQLKIQLKKNEVTVIHPQTPKIVWSCANMLKTLVETGLSEVHKKRNDWIGACCLWMWIDQNWYVRTVNQVVRRQRQSICPFNLLCTIYLSAPLISNTISMVAFA